MKKCITTICLIRKSTLIQSGQLISFWYTEHITVLEKQAYELWSFSGGIELLDDISHHQKALSEVHLQKGKLGFPANWQTADFDPTSHPYDIVRLMLIFAASNWKQVPKYSHTGLENNLIWKKIISSERSQWDSRSVHGMLQKFSCRRKTWKGRLKPLMFRDSEGR